jgi:hypothetical protein
MKSICEYQLTRVVQQLTLPKHSVILHIGVFEGNACLWILIDTDQVEKEEIEVRSVGTNEPCDYDLDAYLGTVSARSFSRHLFLTKFHTVRPRS